MYCYQFMIKACIITVFFGWTISNSLAIDLNWEKLSLIRSSNNPIIYPEMENLEDKIGTNINGPSVISVPDWLENPLGKYYLYFAHHNGKYIRLAFANSPEGPWTIHQNGSLHIDDTMAYGHIASPDVHVDKKSREIKMYFHGIGNRQRTFIAISKDGIHFSANPTYLGPPYFRVFHYKDCYFAIAKQSHKGSGILMRSSKGFMPFKKGPTIIPNMRHAAVHINDEKLTIFYSRIGDTPERIFRSTVKLQGNWNTWKASKPIEILRPKFDYEGSKLPIEISKAGMAFFPKHQIRDPALLVIDKTAYLYYSLAGEQGIGVARFFIKK